MIRRWGGLIMPAMALLTDIFALMIGTWLAYEVRFSEFVTARIPVVNELPPIEWYSKLGLVLIVIYSILSISNGLYRLPRPTNIFDDIFDTLKVFIVSWTLLLAGIFFYRAASFSRLTLLLLLMINSFMLIFSRILWMNIRQWLYRQGLTAKRVAIAGEGPQVERIVRNIVSNPQFGLSLVGLIRNNNDTIDSLTLLGGYEKIGQIIRKFNIDMIIVVGGLNQPELVSQLVNNCYGINVNFLYIPDIEYSYGGTHRIVEIGGIPFWALKETPFVGWPGLVKRIFDFLISLIILILLSPLMLLLAVLVKLSSPGPVFYSQRRVGLDGKVFNCLKFRSMYIGAEDKTGAVWAKPGDTRVTPFGRFMRRFSLDELPQLWNVLRGDMSLVGPRPERPEFVSQFEKILEGYQERHRVRAGLTGWAQVNGLRGNTSIEERTKYDRYYVENWSLMFDLKILFMTIVAVIKGENSY